jgi:galactokinase
VTTAWRAPGRVNLIGEHTDYNGGFVLPLAIEQGCTAKVTRRPDGLARFTSAQRAHRIEAVVAELAPGQVAGWASYPAGSVWAVHAAGRDVTGLAVHIDSNVPPGAGLSSSAAVVCSVTAAVAEEFGGPLDPDDLVTLARRAENDFVGAPTGGMDQLASVKCTAGHVLLCDMRSLATEQVPFDLESAGLRLLVTDTRAAHQHSDGEYGARRAACEEAARVLGVPSLRDVSADLLQERRDALLAAADGDDVLLRRARHVVTENARVLETAALLRAGDVAGVGPLLLDSHASMLADFEITVAEVDAAVKAAITGGAIGARMTGGGFGGCVISLVPEGQVEEVRRSIGAAFAEVGFAEPAFFTATPAAGAHPVPH